MVRKAMMRALGLAAAALVLACSACTAAGAGTTATTGSSKPAVQIRWLVLPGTDQMFLPQVLESKGIAAKYGFTIKTVPIANTNTETVLQGGAADLIADGFISTISLPAKGVDVKVVGAFEGYGNYLMALPDGPTSLEQLKGGNLGTFSNTQIDYITLRAAIKKLYGFDINTDTKVVPAAPGLLNELLTKKQADVVLQFSSLGFQPVQQGQFKNISTIADLIKKAGWNENNLDLDYVLGPKWMKAHPGGAQKVADMIAEGQKVLLTDDSVWPDLAKSVHIPASLTTQYMKAERGQLSAESNYSQAMADATRTFYSQLIAEVGVAGFPGGNPEFSNSLFVFPTGSKG